MIIVEAALEHLNSINRTILNCMENDQPAVCMNLKICFSYTGREVPGYIGKLLGKKSTTCTDLKCTCLQNNTIDIQETTNLSSV